MSVDFGPLIAVRDAALAAIKTALPALRDCAAHPGRFDVDEMTRFLTLAPSVRVALLGVERIEDEASGFIDVTGAFAAFVVASGNVRQPGGEDAAAIVTALIELIHGNDWGLDATFEAEVKRADNLYGAGIDAKGAALWALSFAQTVRIGKTMFDETGVVPSRVYAGIAPAIGAAHIGDYVDVASGETIDG